MTAPLLRVLILQGLLVLACLSPGRLAAQTKEPSGYYVLQSAEATAAVADSILNDRDIAGVVLRRRWSDVNPSSGTYDWNYLDREISRARTRGKKAQIVVLAGTNAPAWLYAAGARQLKFQDSRYGKQIFTMPVPWDDVMLERWTTLVRALGARYDRDPTVTVVHMAGPTRFSAEMFIPLEATKLSDWSPARLTAAWDQVIAAFKGAFPNTVVSLNVAHPTSGSIAEDVTASAVSSLGRLVSLQHNSLSDKTAMS